MTEVEEALLQTKSKAGEDALNFPIRIMNQIVDLSNVVQGADGAPPAQTYEVFDYLNKQLDVQLAKWKDIQDHELAALNEQMKQHNIPGVSIPPAKKQEEGGGRGRRGNRSRVTRSRFFRWRRVFNSVAPHFFAGQKHFAHPR